MRVFQQGNAVEEKIVKLFEEASALVLESGGKNAALILHMGQELIRCFEQGNKLLLFGNGGSASQAQHFSAELVNKLTVYRAPLPAIALTTDSSVLTSIGNDLDFSDIFSRPIEALGKKGDVAWGFSTSGKSPNVLKALERARELGLRTIAFSGKNSSAMAQHADFCLSVAADNTARVQEVHLCAGHAVCTVVEEHFLSSK
jgi:D-sedoheptulose 7-phosphate isomerase